MQVAPERPALYQRFLVICQVLLQVAVLRKPFVAVDALEWFCTSVADHVRLQMRFLRKSFAARVAHVRLFVGVDEHVPIQVAHLPKFLIAARADVHLLTVVTRPTFIIFIVHSMVWTNGASCCIAASLSRC